MERSHPEAALSMQPSYIVAVGQKEGLSVPSSRPVLSVCLSLCLLACESGKRLQGIPMAVATPRFCPFFGNRVEGNCLVSVIRPDFQQLVRWSHFLASASVIPGATVPAGPPYYPVCFSFLSLD